MDLHEAIRRRAMVRSFATDPVDPIVVDTTLQAALRAPSAGNTAGTSWVILEGADQTSLYWDSTTDEAWRSTSARSPGLRRAPLILLAYTSAAAYVARYAEEDKAGGGAAGAGPAPDLGSQVGAASRTVELAGPALGLDAAEWPVPYWMGDAAFGVMTVLLCAVDAGLGACVLGNFRGESTLAGALGVPATWSLFGAVILGHPDGNDHPSRSLSRARPDPGERIHRGSW
jgi:nitroreductase